MKNCHISVLKNLFLFLLGGLSVTCCKKEFEDYYRGHESASIKMMEVIRDVPDYSLFVEYLEKFSFDTLFTKNQSYTLFIPVNSSFEGLTIPESELHQIMGYNITYSVILPSQVTDDKKIQTLLGKFSILEKNEGELIRDGITLHHNNPLYQDGTFYSLDEILRPRPNLFEYMLDTCPILAHFIMGTDSIAFDPLISQPIGFDTLGNTIYDSIFELVNTFERDYFAISEEFRSNTATMVLCSDIQYKNALDNMALNLGSPYNDHNDIPDDWQQGVLIPYIFNKGVFIGSMDFEEFKFPLLQNIQGDSIEMDYTIIDESSRYVCSNGISFLYSQFDIPLNLYSNDLILEGENLVSNINSQVRWDDDIITDNILYQPELLVSTEASGGKYVSVSLPRGFNDTYYIEFLFPKVFPNIYKFVWRANYRPSGNISIFVNDNLVGSYDNYYFRLPVDGNKPTTSGFNQKEWTDINIEKYGDIRIRMEYQSAGAGISNGINIDYVALFPVD